MARPAAGGLLRPCAWPRAARWDLNDEARSSRATRPQSCEAVTALSSLAGIPHRASNVPHVTSTQLLGGTMLINRTRRLAAVGLAAGVLSAATGAVAPPAAADALAQCTRGVLWNNFNALNLGIVGDLTDPYGNEVCIGTLSAVSVPDDPTVITPMTCNPVPTVGCLGEGAYIKPMLDIEGSTAQTVTYTFVGIGGLVKVGSCRIAVVAGSECNFSVS